MVEDGALRHKIDYKESVGTLTAETDTKLLSLITQETMNASGKLINFRNCAKFRPPNVES